MPFLSLKQQKYTLAELFIIVGLAIVPLFVTFPYRVNIFLSWEGAYRLSSGQVPFKDFGSPLGYGFWIIPALFFKIFGPQLISLIKAQVLINIMGGLAFRSILKSLGVTPQIRFLSVLVFVLSYSYSNFWPWYNHTVIIYELIGLSFLLRYQLTSTGKIRFVYLTLAALFTFLSLFTKQDGGGMALLVCLALLGYSTLLEKKWWEIPLFLGIYGLMAILFIAPLMPGFGYWFNHGQAPHNSRLSPNDFISEIMGSSQWIKVYFLLMVICLMPAFSRFKSYWQNKQQMLFILLTLGILTEAALFQVTSYTPPDNNIFFHSFAFAFIVSQLNVQLHLKLEQWKPVLVATVLVLFWWSGVYWKYFDKVLSRINPETTAHANTSATGENVVSRNNYMVNTDTTDVPTSKWVFSSLPEFRKIYMPPSTVEGIDRIMALPVVKEKKGDIKVLNMTELTPLAHAMPYKMETGADFPLWYHLGVGMFNQQLAAFTQKVQQQHYDLILYEYAPTLNNFFPFALQKELKQHYKQVDTFLAPRRPTNAIIEVYVKP